MKYLAPVFVLFGLVSFTDPRGLDLWVAKSQVVGVLHSVDCAKGANTKILTASGALCVRESVPEVLKRLDEAAQ